ncbi:MAG: hypothetical protein KTR14_07720, partial [Vampirovibrio sp.]|nr:hypothetical protein [Vampirovibrio sp.]
MGLNSNSGITGIPAQLGAIDTTTPDPAALQLLPQEFSNSGTLVFPQSSTGFASTFVNGFVGKGLEVAGFAPPTGPTNLPTMGVGFGAGLGAGLTSPLANFGALNNSLGITPQGFAGNFMFNRFLTTGGLTGLQMLFGGGGTNLMSMFASMFGGGFGAGAGGGMAIGAGNSGNSGGGGDAGGAGNAGNAGNSGNSRRSDGGGDGGAGNAGNAGNSRRSGGGDGGDGKPPVGDGGDGGDGNPPVGDGGDGGDGQPPVGDGGE